MNKTTEALKLAEEALAELRYANDTDIAKTKYYKALAAVSEALAEQEKQENQEPVGVISESAIGLVKLHSNGVSLPFGTPLYAAPVKREWVDLTDDEIFDAYTSDAHENTPKSFAHAVIAAFKEKNK